MTVADDTDIAPTPTPPPVVTRRCDNCGVPLMGEHCYACGQPTKGLVRHFSSVLGDFFDTVFNIDSRVIHTIVPLLTKPGFLSLEYFAGRRVRYVTPMRLFLFLSLVAFFAVQGTIESNEDGDFHSDDNQTEISRAASPEEVQRISGHALAELDKARKKAVDVPGATAGIDIAREKLQDQAKKQIDYLTAVDAAKKAGKPLPKAPKDDDENNVSFPVNGKPWDPKTNPVSYSWLPAPINRSLNHRLERARDVLRSKNNQKPIIDALFNVLPQTLIVLMPIFALMLKVAYWFKRRLYMEHLIVALHSHSFMALAVTLIVCFSWAQNLLAPTPGFWNSLLGWGKGLTSLWIPLYLLLMQKRVYGQGWPMTLAKFAVLGLCYSVLLSLALAAAVMIGLLTL
jgi:hypothetical protein